ncbi:membrane protein insertion efficiency factor YidD [Actinotignum urinale]|uniref:membrane protein insertion efficiency factor YidD n=1 Tax=Actinotignum urinale TaxID=190146 RepID=UPI0035322250
MKNKNVDEQREFHFKNSTGPVGRVFIRLIRWYQRNISPARPPRCRYSPTCSAYALEALRIHGGLKGTILAVWRLLRCNPFTNGGVDRVPPRGQWPSRPLDHDELLELYAKEDEVPDTRR